MKIVKNYAYRESSSPVDYREGTFTPVEWIGKFIKNLDTFDGAKEVEGCDKKIASLSMSDVGAFIHETNRIEGFVRRARGVIKSSQSMDWDGNEKVITREGLFFSPAEELSGDEGASMVIGYIFKISDHGKTFIISPLIPIDWADSNPGFIRGVECPLHD